MPYTPPKFVNNLDIWDFPGTPAAGPAPHTNQPFQVYAYSRTVDMWLDSTTGHEVPLIIIREPKISAFPVRVGSVVGKDLPPPNDDLLWLVLFKIRVHTGFPNEYNRLTCVQCTRTGAVVVQPRP